LEALAEGAGLTTVPRKRRELGDIAGTRKADKAIEAALAEQDRVDKDGR
jgi:hypothetical protein